MELSWSTFLLEIINFLVLVWILKRFLYKPVLEVIARRKAGIEKRLAEARDLRVEAEELQQRYEGRLAEWEKEQQQARQKLSQDLDLERAARIQKLHSQLEQEREKAKVAEERRQADILRGLEESALQQGARFATRLLEGAAGPDLHQRLVELLIDGLSGLPPERIAALADTATPPDSVRISSAYALDETSRTRLQQALAPLVPRGVPCQFQEDQNLIAGLRVTLGAWVLAANLRDELKGFGELSDGDPAA